MTTVDARDSGAALEEAAAELERAAWREGIDRDGILGPFVTAMRAVLVRLAQVQGRHEVVLAANIEAARQLSESEARQLREMLRGAAIALQQARSAEAQLQIQRETVVATLIAQIGPQLGEGIKHWQVIRETERNRRAARIRAAATAAAALGLVLGGYAGRAWQDRAATTALERCLRDARIDPVTDLPGCALHDLLPR